MYLNFIVSYYRSTVFFIITYLISYYLSNLYYYPLYYLYFIYLFFIIVYWVFSVLLLYGRTPLLACKPQNTKLLTLNQRILFFIYSFYSLFILFILTLFFTVILYIILVYYYICYKNNFISVQAAKNHTRHSNLKNSYYYL